jgi:DNA-binding transcriptional MerR regulator
MRISDLSRESGIPIATIKFYLREELLPQGHLTARNQATYDDRHLRRLHLVRTLAEVGGLSLESIRRVLDALARKDAPLHEVLAVAHMALRREESADDPALPAARSEIDAWLTRRGWKLSPGTPAADDIAGTLLALRRLGWNVGPEVFDRYAEHADAIAEVEIAYVAGTSDPESAVEATVIGTVLFERALASLRLLAQEHHSRKRLGR